MSTNVIDITGANGNVVTTNTTAVTGRFSTLQILEDATFTQFVEVGSEGQAMTGFVVPAGMVLYGTITGYTLSAGKVRAYKAA